jgi:elongation factor P--(R)-beta-lysine ligase
LANRARDDTRESVLSPSDPLPRPPFQMAGRVVSTSEGVVVVADALSIRPVHVTGAVSPGDLVVIDIVGAQMDGLVGSAIHIVGKGAVGPETDRLRARGAFLQKRAELIARVREFFVARGYLEVETPLVVPSPGLDVHLLAVPAGDRYLITSPEYQMKRLLAGGLPRIFQIVKCFRRGEIGARHNPEFTMVEWYRAYSDVHAMIGETEALIVSMVPSLTAPFERLPIAEAFRRHAGVDVFALSEDDFFRIMVEKVEPALTHPVVLTEWPIAQASLARKCSHDPRVAERFEIMVRGIELCNGFGELVDPVEQRARFTADQADRARRGLPVYPIDERFVAALEEGMPPSAGNALGLDRLIALALGARTIGDVMTFPEEWL